MQVQCILNLATVQYSRTRPELGHAVVCIEYAYYFLHTQQTYAVLAHHIAAVGGGSSRYMRYKVLGCYVLSAFVRTVQTTVRKHFGTAYDESL